MKIDIKYSKKSIKFIQKNSNLLNLATVNKLILKSLQRILNNKTVNIDLKRLKGEIEDFYRIRKGNIRIIFKVYKEQIIIVSVKTIGFRGNVY